MKFQQLKRGETYLLTVPHEASRETIEFINKECASKLKERDIMLIVVSEPFKFRNQSWFGRLRNSFGC